MTLKKALWRYHHSKFYAATPWGRRAVRLEKERFHRALAACFKHEPHAYFADQPN